MSSASFAEAKGKVTSSPAAQISTPPIPFKLKSYPLSEYQPPQQTPPTLDNSSRNRQMSPELLDTPESTFFDIINGKLSIVQSLSIWRQRYLEKRQRSELFQSSMNCVRFDLDSRVDSILLSKSRLIKRQVLNSLANEAQISRSADVVAKLLRRRSVNRTFSQWQSYMISRLQMHTELKVEKNEAMQGEDVQDLIGKLHAHVSCQAELETELEKKEEQIKDTTDIVHDFHAKVIQKKLEIEKSEAEGKRIFGIKADMEQSYKDQIAQLRMTLKQKSEDIGEKLNGTKYLLSLNTEAKTNSREALERLKETVQNQMQTIREKLTQTQKVAIRLRDELVESQSKQREIASDIEKMRREIGSLKDECVELDNCNRSREDESKKRIEGLRKLYEEASEQMKKAQKKVDDNQKELNEDDVQIETLSAELSIQKQRCKAAIEAFDDGNAK